MNRVSIALFVMIHGCLSLGDNAGRSDGGASVDVMNEDRSVDVTADGATSAGCTGPDRAICNGVCVPLTTDENCGGCGTACAITSGERCVRASTGGSADGGTTPDGGARVAFCQVQCPRGQVLCDNGCRDLTNDPNHCRTCGNQCLFPNAVAACTGGVCVLSSCREGFGNCDGNTANGCETTTSTDATNCGGCGRLCSIPNGTAGCAAGACTVGACAAGFGNCNSSALDGCEVNLTIDRNHCGGCGAPCAAGQVCSNGTCRVSCEAGTSDCSGVCRNTQTDNNHCGGCGRVCPAGQLCSAGVCLTICSTGQTMCSGTCRDLRSDNSNCGACGRACTGGAACAAGNCVCPTGQTACSGTCRALQTDNSNCGICGRVCAAGTVCSAGVCASTCAAPTTNCSGVCRDLQNDANNCNACGTVCTRANGVAGCSSGACALAACSAGFGNCDGVDANGCEVNTGTSVTNCGVCGNSCQFANAAASCVAGRCTRGACAAGFANCDGVDSNGCEVNTVVGDINNCGACNNRCPTPPIGSIAVCANSMCTTSSVSCPAGIADCDGAPGNGCEVATTTVSNCGACGRACVGTNGTATCVSQLCGITCNTGFGDCNGNAGDGCEARLNTNASCGRCMGGAPITTTCGAGMVCAAVAGMPGAFSCQ